MPDHTDDDAWKRDLLATPRRIAVVGASANPERDAHRIFVALKEAGHDVLPVNPAYDAVAGVATVPDLETAAAHWPEGIEVVDVFRAPEHLPEIVDAAVAVDAKVLWCQFGVVHPDAIRKALAAGMDVVVDRCIKVEMQRLT